MATVNEQLYDSAVRSQIFLQRYGNNTVARKIRVLLAKADARLVARITGRIERLGPVDRQVAGRGLVTTVRLKQMLEEVRVLNADLFTAVNESLRDDLIGVAEAVVERAARELDAAVGVDLGNLRPSPTTLRSIVTSEPFRGRHLREFVKDMEAGRLRGIKTSIQLGMIEGRTTPQIMRELRREFGVTKRKAEVLARTATNHIGNRAREQFYQRNADIVDKLRWSATLDGRTSPVCRARDARTYPLTTGPRPPAHPNCLPGDALVLSRDGISAASKRWFDGELVVIRTAQGREIVATPNHPILTNRGWFGIGRIEEGCRLVCQVVGERVLPADFDYVQDRPSGIEDVFEAVQFSKNARLTESKVAPEDFHGDGSNGEVAIIVPNGLLLDAVNAVIRKHVYDALFGWSHVGQLSFAGLGASDKFFVASDVPRLSFASAAAKFRFCFGRHASHAQAQSLRPIAHGTRSRDVVEDGSWVDAESLRDRISASASDVQFDDVVDVVRRQFHGYVFNLETASGQYGVNGIVTHNCRSVMVAVTKSWSELAGQDLDSARPAKRIDALFEKQLAKQGFGPEAIKRQIREARASMNGVVPAKETYQTWLKRQPAAFQDETLGKTRGKLFRQGKLPLTKFVDMRSGKQFTLAQLAKKEPAAFRAASVDTPPVKLPPVDVGPGPRTPPGAPTFTFAEAATIEEAEAFTRSMGFDAVTDRNTPRPAWVESLPGKRETLIQLNLFNEGAAQLANVSGRGAGFGKNIIFWPSTRLRAAAEVNRAGRAVGVMVGTRVVDDVTKRSIKIWEKTNGRRRSARDLDLEDWRVATARHEIGHNLTSTALENEFTHLIRINVINKGKNSVEWIRDTVSQYAGTNIREAIAESVSLVKSPYYVRGTVPKWLEDFVDKVVREG